MIIDIIIAAIYLSIIVFIFLKGNASIRFNILLSFLGMVTGIISLYQSGIFADENGIGPPPALGEFTLLIISLILLGKAYLDLRKFRKNLQQ